MPQGHIHLQVFWGVQIWREAFRDLTANYWIFCIRLHSFSYFACEWQLWIASLKEHTTMFAVRFRQTCRTGPVGICFIDSTTCRCFTSIILLFIMWNRYGVCWMLPGEVRCSLNWSWGCTSTGTVHVLVHLLSHHEPSIRVSPHPGGLSGCILRGSNTLFCWVSLDRENMGACDVVPHIDQRAIRAVLSLFSTHLAINTLK